MLSGLSVRGREKESGTRERKGKVRATALPWHVACKAGGARAICKVVDHLPLAHGCRPREGGKGRRKKGQACTLSSCARRCCAAHAAAAAAAAAGWAGGAAGRALSCEAGDETSLLAARAHAVPWASLHCSPGRRHTSWP